MCVVEQKVLFEVRSTSYRCKPGLKIIVASCVKILVEPRLSRAIWRYFAVVVVVVDAVVVVDDDVYDVVVAIVVDDAVVAVVFNRFHNIDVFGRSTSDSRGKAVERHFDRKLRFRQTMRHSVCLFVHLSVCLFVLFTICPFVQFVLFSTYLFVCLSVCPLIYLSVYPLV